jgi:uncharacterized protein (DUF302 family)
MSYYFNKSVRSDFETTVQNVTVKLKEKGFGILSEIDVQATLNKKLDVDFYKYKILGACNPHFAHQALLLEDKVGVMLPCNVIVQQKSENDKVEVSAVDPVSSMQAITNDKLAGIAGEVKELLSQVIDNLE